MANENRQGIYKNLKIVDFTIALAGVFNTWQYSDNGADVWKIEKYGSGDQSRFWGPFNDDGDFSTLYASFNRNKRSIEVNLRSPEGKALILELVKNADLVVDNFKAGTLDKLGLGYDVLKEVNPKIVYASLSGFGTNGPLNKLPCYDHIASARSGLLAKNGDPDGVPIKPGYSISDNFTGINFHFATNMALLEARRTGKSVYVDIAMTDNSMISNAECLLDYSTGNEVKERTGDHSRFLAPFGMFECGDGYFTVVCRTEETWNTFCDVLNPAWKTDDRFINNCKRIENQKTLIKEIEVITKKMHRNEIETQLLAKGVPAAGVLRFEEVVFSKHIKEGSLTFIDQKKCGRFPHIANPVKFSKTPGLCKFTGSPLLGADTVDILKENNFTDEQIQHLEAVKAIGINSEKE